MIALDIACSEAEWLRDLLYELPFVSKPIAPIALNCDCRSAIDKCSQENADVRMNRYLKMRHQSIRYKLKNNVVILRHVNTERNLADHLTKPLSKTLVLSSSRGMGVMP